MQVSDLQALSTSSGHTQESSFLPPSLCGCHRKWITLLDVRPCQTHAGMQLIPWRALVSQTGTRNTCLFPPSRNTGSGSGCDTTLYVGGRWPHLEIWGLDSVISTPHRNTIIIWMTVYDWSVEIKLKTKQNKKNCLTVPNPQKQSEVSLSISRESFNALENLFLCHNARQENSVVWWKQKMLRSDRWRNSSEAYEFIVVAIWINTLKWHVYFLQPIGLKYI